MMVLPKPKAALWLFLSLLTACSFEQDDRFVPRWQQSWLLTQGAVGSSPVLWQLDSLGMRQRNEAPLQMAGAGERWYSLQANGDLARRDPATGDILARWAIPSGRGDQVAIGLDKVLVADSVGPWLHFFDPQRETWLSDSLCAPVTALQPFEDRSFVVLDDTLLYLYQEQMAAARDSMVLPEPVAYLQRTDGHRLSIFTRRNGSLGLVNSSYHGLSPVSGSRRQSADLILISPFARQSFGQEYLGRIEVDTAGCWNQLCADHWEPMWKAGQAWLYQDSRWRRVLLASQDTLQVVMQPVGSVLAAFHWIAPDPG